MAIPLSQRLTELSRHQGFRKYLANTSWMLSEQTLRIFAGLVVGVWVARYLGPERFGTFSYAVAFASIFGSVAKLGLDSILVRDLVGDPEQAETFLGTSFWLKTAGAVAALALVAVAGWMSESDSSTRLYILLIAASFLFQPFEVIDFYFQSRVLSKFVSLCRIFQLLLSSALKLYLILIRADLVWFVAVLIADQLSLAAALHVAYRLRGSGRFYRRFNPAIAKSLLRDSYPFILAGIFLMVQARLDQVMLKTLIGAQELGYYSAALRLIEAVAFVPSILVGSLFPAVVNSRRASQALYETRLYRLYRLMMLLFVGMAAPLFLFGDQIVLLVYKNAFAPAGPLLALLSFRLLFANFGVARNAYLTAENRAGYALATMILGASVNAGLNFLLIPQYQSRGAIFAALGSFAVSTFLADLFYPPTRQNALRMVKALFLVWP